MFPRTCMFAGSSAWSTKFIREKKISPGDTFWGSSELFFPLRGFISWNREAESSPDLTPDLSLSRFTSETTWNRKQSHVTYKQPAGASEAVPRAGWIPASRLAFPLGWGPEPQSVRRTRLRGLPGRWQTRQREYIFRLNDLTICIHQLFKLQWLNTNCMPFTVMSNVKNFRPIKDEGSQERLVLQWLTLHRVQVEPWQMSDVAKLVDTSRKPCAWNNFPHHRWTRYCVQGSANRHLSSSLTAGALELLRAAKKASSFQNAPRQRWALGIV